MPKISSYPIISIPGLEDLLIGTDINNLDETKNFRLSDISVLLGSGYVPYTGATGNINLGAFGITSNSFIKSGGTSLQFLKADGSVDNTEYTPQSRTITINGVTYDLSANRSWSFGGVDVLTTSGSSGPATYVEGFLNIPQYQPAGNYITSLTGEATGSGPGAAAVTLSNSAVIGKLLTGFNVIAGSIVSSDSILQAFGKAQSQINSLVSGVSFRGTWNASTNTPALASGVGTGGHYYIVSVAGSTTLNGVSSWAVGDWVVFNGVSSVWQRVPNTQLVSSVNGFTGAVSITSSDVGAAPTSRTLTINGTAFDLSANRSWIVGDIRSDQSYGNPSWITSIDWAKVTSRPSTLAGYGIINAVLSTNTITINGIGYDLSANRVWSVGTVTSVSTTGPLTGGTITGSGTIGITQAGPTSNGYLSSADWNMFNNKVGSISATTPISFASGVISISQAGVASDGYLSQSDWNAFNNKQDALVNPITGIGTSGVMPIFNGSGTVSDGPISYLSNSVTVNYNSTIGNSFVLQNTGVGTYSYSVIMDNSGINKITKHSYSEGIFSEYIGENQVRRVFANGNMVLGVSTVDNGNKLSVYGPVFISSVSNATSNTDKFLVSDSGVIKYRTASELFSDIGSSRSITINGVSQNLSADRSWSVGTVTSVSVSAPVGLTVTGSPVTSAGTIAIAFASGYSIPTNGAQASWDIAYNNTIVSAAVTGTTTKTLTLNQQDGGTITASWVESGGGGGTITLTGPVTGSGTTSIATSISNNAVTNAMLSQIQTSRIKGRVSAGTGNIEDLTGTQVTTLLDTFTSTLKGVVPASGGGIDNFLRADGSWALPPLITANEVVFNDSGSGASSGTTFNGAVQRIISFNTIGAQAASSSLSSLSGLAYVSGAPFVKMTSANTFALDNNIYLTGNQTITLSGDVTGSGATSISTTIANNAVSLAKMAQISTARILGRVTAATGNVESLTGTQVTTLLDVFTSTLKGVVPASGGGTTNFLRADGTWAAPSGGGGISGSGTTNYIPKFTSGTDIGNSAIVDTGTQIYYRSTATVGTPSTWDHVFGVGNNRNLVLNNATNPSVVSLRAFTDAGANATMDLVGDSLWLNGYTEVLYYSATGGQHRFVVGVVDPVFLITGTAATSYVNFTAPSLIKSGATSSDVLYGDGSTKKITSGTAAPSGGSNGDIYLQYV